MLFVGLPMRRMAFRRKQAVYAEPAVRAGADPWRLLVSSETGTPHGR